jgi:hypothetical protein
MKPNWRRIFIGILMFLLGIVLFAVLNMVSGYWLANSLVQLSLNNPIKFLGLNAILMTLTGALGTGLARRKGRSRKGWFMACFMFHIPALIYLWALPEAKKREARHRVT